MARKTWLAAHRWLGVGLGVLWGVQGFTGALLVFHREAQRLVEPPLSQASMASLDAIAAASASAAAVGHGRVERIRVLDERGDLLGADYTDHHEMPQLIRIEAGTGRLLETIPRMPWVPGRGTFWRWVYSLHHELLLGRSGAILIGVSGVFLFSTLLVGAFIGWPPRRAWRAAFEPKRWRTTAQRLYGWHRMLGLTSGLLLVASALTGTYIVFESSIRAALSGIIPHRVKFTPAAMPDEPLIRVSPEQAWRIAHDCFPLAKFESIALPRPEAPAYIVRLTQAAEPRVWAGVTSVAIDPGSGRVIDRYDAVRAPWSNRVGDALWPAHNGEILGVPGRLLVLAAGAVLPAFAVTGLWSWWRRQNRRRRPVAAT